MVVNVVLYGIAALFLVLLTVECVRRREYGRLLRAYAFFVVVAGGSRLAWAASDAWANVITAGMVAFVIGWVIVEQRYRRATA